MDEVAKTQQETETNLFDAEALAASAGTLVPGVFVRKTISAIDAALSKIAQITDPDLVGHDSNGFTKEEREAMAEAAGLEKPLGPQKKLSAEEIEQMIRDELEPTQKDLSESEETISRSPASPVAGDTAAQQQLMLQLCPLPTPSPIAGDATQKQVLPLPPADPVIASQRTPDPEAKRKAPRKPRATNPVAKNAKPRNYAKSRSKVERDSKTKATRAKATKAKAVAAVVPAIDETQLSEDALLRKKLHSVTW